MIAPVEATAPAQVRRLNLSVLVLNAGFVVTGVATTLLGPLLPGLSSRWSLSDAQAGLFFTMQFLGSIGGVALSSALLPSWGYRFTIAAGFVVSGAGIAALGLGSWTAGLLSAAIFATKIRKVSNRFARNATLASGGQPTAPIPQARLSRLSAAAGRVTDASATNKFVPLIVNPRPIPNIAAESNPAVQEPSPSAAIPAPLTTNPAAMVKR